MIVVFTRMNNYHPAPRWHWMRRSHQMARAHNAAAVRAVLRRYIDAAARKWMDG